MRDVDLNEDIVGEILDHLPAPAPLSKLDPFPDHEIGYLAATKALRSGLSKDLRNCALVSSNWRYPAQIRLFKTVNVNRSFVENLLREDSSQLSQDQRFLAYVQEATIEVNSRQLGTQLHSAEDLGKALIALFKRCKALSSITIRYTQDTSAPSNSGLSDQTFSALQEAGHDNTVRSLDYEQTTDFGPLFFQIVSLFPSLTHLTTRNHAFQRNVSNPAMATVLSPPSTLKCKAQLQELMIGEGNCTDTTLQWILGASSDSLRILDIRRHGDYRAEPTLASLARHLETLRVLNPSQVVLDIGNMFPKLKGFCFAHLPGDQYAWADGAGNPFLNSVNRLEILCMAGYDRNLLKVVELPNLREVALHTHRGFSVNMQAYEPLRKRCRLKKISLTVESFSGDPGLHVVL